MHHGDDDDAAGLYLIDQPVWETLRLTTAEVVPLGDPRPSLGIRTNPFRGLFHRFGEFVAEVGSLIVVLVDGVEQFTLGPRVEFEVHDSRAALIRAKTCSAGIVGASPRSSSSRRRLASTTPGCVDFRSINRIDAFENLLGKFELGVPRKGQCRFEYFSLSQ